MHASIFQWSIFITNIVELNQVASDCGTRNCNFINPIRVRFFAKIELYSRIRMNYSIDTERKLVNGRHFLEFRDSNRHFS